MIHTSLPKNKVLVLNIKKKPFYSIIYAGKTPATLNQTVENQVAHTLYAVKSYVQILDY